MKRPIYNLESTLCHRLCGALCAAAFFLTGSSAAAGTHNIRLAIIAEPAGSTTVSALTSHLEVELSGRDGVELLERSELNHMLAEHRLSLAGLSRQTAIKAGRLARAAAFLLVSAEDGKDGLVRIRLVDRNNTLLNGDPVVSFVSTPYGLVGLGSGTVATIAIGSAGSGDVPAETDRRSAARTRD